MEEITTHRLRQIIKNELLNAIRNVGHSRSEYASVIRDNVSDYEVETFILTNPYFDETLAIQLTDRHFAGFHPFAKIYEYGEEGFVQQVRKWANSKEWLQLLEQ